MHAEATALNNQGKEAMDRGEFVEAVRLLRIASSKWPENQTIQQNLQKAEDARDGKIAELAEEIPQKLPAHQPPPKKDILGPLRVATPDDPTCTSISNGAYDQLQKAAGDARGWFFRHTCAH